MPTVTTTTLHTDRTIKIQLIMLLLVLVGMAALGGLVWMGQTAADPAVAQSATLAVV